jgi:hypothetical protein
VLVLARDPDFAAGTEKCFIEHMESIIIPMLDLCHTKDGHSTRMARSSQHRSLLAERENEAVISEDLNRMLSVNRLVNSHLLGGDIECRNCNLGVLKYSYSAHLDDEGDTRTIHIYEICDADLKSPATLRHHLRDLHDPRRPFECDYEDCNKAFNMPGLLANHVKTTPKRNSYLIRERESLMSVPLREYNCCLTLRLPVNVVSIWCYAFVN